MQKMGFDKFGFLAAALIIAATPAVAQQKPAKKVGNLFKVIGGQPRDSRKVGLSFLSIHGVEIYFPMDWDAKEVPEGWELRLTRIDTDKDTDIHMLEKQTYSLDQVRVEETDHLQKYEFLKDAPEGKRRHIGDYKNIPGLEVTYLFGKDSENLRHVVYFGYPPFVHSLVLDCHREEFEKLKPDFEHILSTISIHDGVH